VNIPGKILFFGGYSVLEAGHVSLSFAVVDDKGYGVTATTKENDSDFLVSKQFGIEQRIDSPDLIKENVATAAFFLTKLYLETKGVSKSYIVSLTNSPMFGLEYKSGLGSSAAAAVAVVKSIFSAHGIDTYGHIETIHKLAQYSCAAFTNKIGSGFDVATCSVGHTIIYNRFSPSSIVLPSDFNNAEETRTKLLSSMEKPWLGLLIRPLSLPSKYDILFFNIERGKTSTVSNVRTVAQWKSQHATEYAELMRMQNDCETQGIIKLLEKDDEGLRQCTHSARELHRKLQEKVAQSFAGLDPIEPEPLEHLIGFAETIRGTVAGRCPGAGGWDGLAFIIDRDRFDKGGIDQIVLKAKGYGLTLTPIPLHLL
jgi:ERG8-type phosphomevalonate kinase